MGDVSSQNDSWKNIAAGKQKERNDRIRAAWRIDVNQYRGRRNVIDVPSTCGILNPDELRITSDFDAVSLVERLRDGLFTAEEVVTAFCKRAAVAQQVVG